MNTSMNNSNNVVLSDVVVSEILSYVGIGDLITCRLVSVQWRRVSYHLLKSKIKPIRFDSSRQLKYFLSIMSPTSKDCPLQSFELYVNVFKLELLEKFLTTLRNQVTHCWFLYEVGVPTHRFEDSLPQYSHILAHSLQNFKHLEYLHLRLFPFSFTGDTYDFNLLKLKRLEIDVGDDGCFGAQNLISRLIQSAPSLQEFSFSISCDDFSAEDENIEDSILPKLPKLLTFLPKGTVVDLKLTKPSTHTSCDPSFIELLMRTYTELLQLDTAAWTPTHLKLIKYNPEHQQLIWKIQRKHSATLREFNIEENEGMDDFDFTNFTVPKCHILRIGGYWNGASKEFVNIFPNVTKLRLEIPAKQIRNSLEVFVSKLPRLVELELHNAGWNLMTRKSMKAIEHIIKIAISKQQKKLSSNPLGEIKNLRILKLMECDDTAVDWILYISALGQINRLHCLHFHVKADRKPLKKVEQLLCNFHDTVQITCDERSYSLSARS